MQGDDGSGAEYEARLRKIEDSLPSWKSRIQRLEKCHPLEDRVRYLETLLQRVVQDANGNSNSNSNSKRSDAAASIPPKILTAIVDLSSGLVNTIWRTIFGTVNILLRKMLPGPATNGHPNKPPSGTQNESKGKQRHRFLLKAGLDGYSQSLDLDTKEGSSAFTCSDRARISILNKEAVRRELDTYIDPASGYDVFTSHHLKTRECCGSSCRHCPWGHRNVPGKNSRANTSSNCPTSCVESTGDAGLSRPKKSRLYTRKGDTGWGELYNGQSIRKSDPIYEAIGGVDELNSAVGLAIQLLQLPVPVPISTDGSPDPSQLPPAHSELPQQLETIQGWLLDIGSSLCTPRNTTDNARKLRRTVFAGAGAAAADTTAGSGAEPVPVVALENWIDAADGQLVRLRNFILPGGSPGAAALHCARSVCRRTERHVWPLLEADGDAEEGIGVFLNRLSDYLFVAARLDAYVAGNSAGEAIYSIDRRGGDRWQRQVMRN